MPTRADDEEEVRRRHARRPAGDTPDGPRAGRRRGCRVPCASSSPAGRATSARRPPVVSPTPDTRSSFSTTSGVAIAARSASCRSSSATSATARWSARRPARRRRSRRSSTSPRSSRSRSRSPIPARYFDNNVGGTLAVLRAMARTGVRRVRVLLVVRGLRHAGRLAGRRDGARPPDQPVRREQAPVRARCCRRSRRRTASARRSCATSTRRGASDDGAHGEDWTDAPNLVPVVLQAAAGRRPAVRIFGTDHPTARRKLRSATTSTSSTWPTRTYAPSRRSTTRDASLTVNVGTGVGVVGAPRSSTPSRRITGRPDPGRGRPATRGRSRGDLGRHDAGGGGPRLAGHPDP